jgi:broad specificity phosphatase PhoE
VTKADGEVAAGHGSGMSRELYLVRHGETEWSRARKHTGVTDLELLPEGIAQAAQLRTSLKHLLGKEPPALFSSPLRRALDTARLAFPDEPVSVTELLHELRYGAYEGLTSAQIRKERPDWDLWRDGCPGGEHPSEVAARADAFIALLADLTSTIVIFSHGHMLRILAARLLGLDATFGKYLALYPGSISVLSTDHHNILTIDRWNARAGDILAV